MTPRANSLAFTLLTVTALGCSRGPATYPASGRVVFEDGQPVTSGIVEFEGIDQPLNARGAIGPDGTFELRTGEGLGAIAGRHRAIVVQTLAGGIGSMPSRNGPPGSTIEHDHESDHDHPTKVVAPRYADYRTSKLEFEVVPNGENHFVIEVESGGGSTR